MTLFQFIIFISVFLSVRNFVAFGSNSWCPHQFVRQMNRKFEQKTDRYWEFHEQSNTWVEVKLPYDLVSCVNDNCSKVGEIKRKNKEEKLKKEYDRDHEEKGSLKKVEEISEMDLGMRKVSLTKMSETSIWVTGESGSIYERYWNGVQWVIAPHDLPLFAGPAISVFTVNHTILALSEAGFLYQMQINENSQPVWVELRPTLIQSASEEVNQSLEIQIQSGVVSHDGVRVYFCTKNGTLLELSEVEPPRWIHHGQPPGADVAAIADAASIRTEVVYTLSSTGNLYEYDRSSKPLWKKHIWKDRETKDTSLMPLSGCTLHSSSGEPSISLFLLTKGGNLVERRLYRRKWKWIMRGSPKDHHLTSIAPALQDESSEILFSLFFTTSSGSVFKYGIQSYSGNAQYDETPEAWVPHKHPLHAKVARNVPGLQFQLGRIYFALDDGRLAELHPSGLGGENAGPTHHTAFRKKTSIKYIWSILEAPESEGWNAEYCTEERGLTNCITGTKDDQNGSGARRPVTRRPKGTQEKLSYLIPGVSESRKMSSFGEYNNVLESWIHDNFRLRVMHSGRSFFLITDGGLTFEYLYAGDVWLWLKHESLTPMKGALGNYNGSILLVDTYGSLLIRERTSNELAWINCTDLRKGKQVMAGPPWDRMPGVGMKVTAEDAIFFVSKSGRLLQFTVALRNFKWKDCRNPPNTKVSSIVDQEFLRENIVFVIGQDGQLYQYNKVTELWHKHHQSHHLILSRLPGTAMRPLLNKLTGSLFMISADGGLVEYHWNTGDGWNWVEHGTPCKDVSLVSSPGPCFEGNQLFLIGSDGKVYLRYMDQMTWKWKNYGFPYIRERKGDTCVDEDFEENWEKYAEKVNDQDKNCDTKVASTRPIQFSENTVIFELRDGRLAEMQQIEDGKWVWSRIIGTPMSLCASDFWTTLAS